MYIWCLEPDCCLSTVYFNTYKSLRKHLRQCHNVSLCKKKYMLNEKKKTRSIGKHGKLGKRRRK